MKRRLFPGEREIRSLGNLTLTTHRVIHHHRTHVGELSTSVLLDHIQWTQLTYTHCWWTLLAIAGLVGLGLLTTWVGIAALGLPSLLAALVLAVTLVPRRRAALVVGTGASRIELRLESDDHQRKRARDLLDAIEHAAGRSTPGVSTLATI